MSMFPRNTGNSIRYLCSLFTFFFDRFLYHEHVCNTSPILLEPCVHLRTRPNFSYFQPPMPLIHLLVVPTFTPVNPFILEKFSYITKNGWIILLYRDEIIPLLGMDCCTPISTGFRSHRH